MRPFVAYTVPACLFVGFAIHDLFSSFILLLMKYKTAGNTILWKIAFATCMLLFVFVVFQIMVLDFFASPYNVTNQYIGFIIGMNYLLAWLVTVGVSFMLVVRIKLFYGKTSMLFKLMTIYGGVVVVLKAVGESIGLYVCYRVAIGKYVIPNYDPLYPTVALALAFGLTFEAVFSAIGTFSFLYFLTGFQGFKRDIIRDRKFQKEGARLVVIFVLNVIVATLGIWLAIDDNWIDHSAYFVPSCIYSLELYVFLDLSYNNAKDMLISSKDKGSSQTNSKPGIESRQKSTTVSVQGKEPVPQYEKQFRSMNTTQYAPKQYTPYPEDSYTSQANSNDGYQTNLMTSMPPKVQQRQRNQNDYESTKVVNYF
ncbi:hypothetical protein HDV01_001942 [Terramyces sp. JEL0728]|nr:hypothetical protein HDV01_001942 [Terramyces sp. JEL0728]